MTLGGSRKDTLRGELSLGGRPLPFQVVQATPHTLVIALPTDVNPRQETSVDSVTIWIRDTPCVLGRAAYAPHSPFVARREDKPPLPGNGKLSFRDDVYDFNDLLRTGNTSGMRERVDQLHLVWRRKESVNQLFREYANDLIYDLQVYRTPFDEIDRGLEGESQNTIAYTHEAALAWAFPRFSKFFDARLSELASLTANYTKQEHERHGFYFRKLVWSFILASEFLRRTNLKPRGYAGDSVMMRMIYEHSFRGPTIFSKMMHLHPLEKPAAQAVRNRRTFITRAVKDARARTRSDRRLRVLSVACGPAQEIRDLINSQEEAALYEFTLLDQDPHALTEACEVVRDVERQVGGSIQAHYMLQSVRTILQHSPLRRMGQSYDLIYSMGLFDYLSDPVARAVLAELFALLSPGGELVVGNFHPRNTTRNYMEYWADWVLIYRNEEELRGLADGIPLAESTVDCEPSGCQCFLRLRRKG